ncbi:MAG: ATP-binding protein [Parvibaculum sp.]
MSEIISDNSGDQGASLPDKGGPTDGGKPVRPAPGLVTGSFSSVASDLWGTTALAGLFVAGAVGGFTILNMNGAGPAGYLLVGGLVAVGGLSLIALLSGRWGAGRASKARVAGIAADALESLPDPCFVTDRRGVVLFANQAYRHLGLDANDRAMPLERLLAGQPGIDEKLYQLAQSARLGLSDEEELRFVPPAGRGRERVFKAAVQPLGGPTAKVGASIWLLRDMTTERVAAAHAKVGRDKYLAYLDDAPFGFFSANESGEIVYANRTFASLLGRSADQMIAERVKLGDLAASALTPFVQGAADDNGSETIDVDLSGPDGPVSVRIVQNFSLGGEGEAGTSRSIVLPREPEDNTEAHLRDAEMRFARFFNNAPIGVATLNREGIVGSANGAFVTLVGGTPDAGSRFADLVADEDRKTLINALEDAISTGSSQGPIDLKLKQKNAEGAEKTAQLFASYSDAHGGQPSIIAYLIDTSDQKSLEMQFAQSQKMQAVGQLAGGVAHDFNNLLTAIIGFCDLLLARHQAGDPSFADVMQIKQNANRAANLVRQLLAFSRRQTLRPKVLNLTDELAELSNLLSRLLGETVELKITHERDLGLVKVDQNQLEQVVINLAVNARDAMEDGGQLTIRTANVSETDARALDHALMPAADYVLIEVSDTGCGIPKEHLGKIFEPFFTTKDVSKGTGLGLSTVYGIVKQTGGYIFAFSTVGKGTTFRIYLPRHFETAEEAARKAMPEEVTPAADLTGNGTILLVEDEDAVRTFAVRALQTRGYKVLEAESGDVALELVDSHDGVIDLVVSDVVMPNMDGPTMVKKLQEKRPGTKIIFISGYAEDAFAKSLDPSVDFRFLPKPFSLKQLAAAVKETMG